MKAIGPRQNSRWGKSEFRLHWIQSDGEAGRKANGVLRRGVAFSVDVDSLMI